MSNHATAAFTPGTHNPRLLDDYVANLVNELGSNVEVGHPLTFSVNQLPKASVALPFKLLGISVVFQCSQVSHAVVGRIVTSETLGNIVDMPTMRTPYSYGLFD